jgi:hypothetical protein
MLRSFPVILLLLVRISSAQTNSLSFRPVAAEYSTALDRIVMISANPNQLHIYDPVSQSDTKVSLSKAPSSVSVSPDGLHAAVAHDLLVSYVNLSTAAVEKTFTTTITGATVVLGTDWVYLIPGYQGAVASIKIATGTETDLSFVYGSGGRLHPSGKAIYGTRDGLSPNDIEKYDVSTGPVAGQTDSPYHGDYAACGKTWFSPDGTRIYNGCATVYRHSDDPALEMTHITTMAGLSSIASLTESAAAKKVAAIPGAPVYPATTTNDGEVDLFDSAYLKPLGRLLLPQYVVTGTSYAAHAKWVFFDSGGTSLSVVIQADGSSGLLQDFSIQRYPIASPAPCSALFGAKTASAIATGSYATASISVAPDCIYQAVSNNSWIQLVSGAYGSGNGTLTYITRANPGTAPRDGTISLNGQTLTITQDASLATPQPFTRLSYKVADAEYDKALDKIVMVSANPDELHLYNPVTGTDQFVALSAPPFAVSVRPDGLYAAVGHDGWISYVNLSTLSVDRVFQIDSDVHDLVLSGSGWIYGFSPRININIFSLELSTGIESLTFGAFGGGIARLYPNGNYLYVGGNFASKWDISQGVAKLVNNNVNSTLCTNFWIAEDGSRIFTACAKVYRASDIPAQDLQYNGSLAAAASLRWAAHSLGRQSIAVIPDPTYASFPDDELQIYADANLTLSGRLSLPKFPASGNIFSSHGHFVFWNADGSKLFVVAQADSSAQLLSDYGVAAISPSDVTSCAYSITPASANVAGSGGNASATVTTGASCIWSVTPNVQWISTSGNIAYTGPGTATLSVSQNNSIAGRTGTASIANQTYTITQTGVIGALTLYPNSVQTPAGGGTNSAFLNSNANDYPWTASSNVGWITLSVASGQGGTSIQYQVAANQGTSSRSGMITVGDQHLTVVQAGTNNIYGSVTLTPVNVLTSASGGNGAISVAASAPDFNWFAASNASWIAVTGGSAGTGNGQVTYQVQANAGSNSRQGTLTIGDKTFQVNQNGNGGVTLNPASVSVGASGGIAIVAITTSAPDFTWSGSSNVGWLNLNYYPVGGTGNGQVTYTVQQNFSTSPRIGTLTIGGQIFTVTQAGAPSALRFVTVTPCRVVDTRLAPGPFGGPSIAASAQRDFAIPQSACGIPSTAQAYSVNITVVPKAGLGYLTAWPAGQTRPLVSTLNSLDGRIVANAAIVPAGIGGAISTFVTDDSDVILDINGYFAPLSATATLEFYTVTPCRIADTRLAPGPFGGPFLDRGSTRSFPIPSSGCSIPASAAAYSLNITAVPAGPLPTSPPGPPARHNRLSLR